MLGEWSLEGRSDPSELTPLSSALLVLPVLEDLEGLATSAPVDPIIMELPI